MEYSIIRLSNCPEMMPRMAQWFHEKWGIPLDAYLDSMNECIKKTEPVPEWYVALCGGEIMGGVGVIENDFHNRPDLTPNICALYVEEHARCNGIAGRLLCRVCSDMATRGIPTLYLLTDHTSFYERYDWEFFCMAQGDGEEELSRMYIHRM